MTTILPFLFLVERPSALTFLYMGLRVQLSFFLEILCHFFMPFVTNVCFDNLP